MIEQLEQKILSLLETRNGLLNTLQSENDFKLEEYENTLVLPQEKQDTLKEITANYYVNLLLLSNKPRQAEKASETGYFLAYQDKQNNSNREEIREELVHDLENVIGLLKRKCQEKGLVILV
jgi:hypothetical protein